MKLPTLRLRLAPDAVCVRCGQHNSYVEEKCRLCLACLNISLLIYAKGKREQSLDRVAIAQKAAVAATR